MANGNRSLVNMDGLSIDANSFIEERQPMVSPAERAAAMKQHFDMSQSMEFNPPEDSCSDDDHLVNTDAIAVSPLTGDCSNPGRKLYFEDGERRIDYVLAWDTAEKDKQKEAENAKMRQLFERNLEEEGLEVEYDLRERRDIDYIKIYAPWEVLSRYGEVMKIRMPIKEIPDKIRTASFWETITEYIAYLMSPFKLDPSIVPPLPKKFTHTYERGKDYLFAIPENKDLFFSHATRSRIVDYILRRKRYSDKPQDTFSFGIKRLLKYGVYTAAYPLHEGSTKATSKPNMRKLLYENWASWRTMFKLQPLDYIRVYFGEKIGLYFAWLGYYTYMLFLPSIVGLLVFIYGVASLPADLVSQETCDANNNYTMCPKCDVRCPYWDYSTVCIDSQASHMFDNGATVFFAIFMCLWGTIFLEFWKREQSSIQFKWNTITFEEEEEPPRPEYLIRLQNSKYTKKHKVTGIEEPFLPFWRRKVPVYCASASAMVFLVFVALACVVGVYVYRMIALSLINRSDDAILYNNASMVTAATAACINLIIIFVLNYIYSIVAVKLTDWECLRTQSEYDSSLTFKLYVLQFVNYYSSLFYIAFFKGRFTGRPGDYNKLFDARQEECSGGGCLMELVIQLAIIFLGKQLLQNTLVEILLPRINKRIKMCFGGDKDKAAKQRLMPWEKDYILEELGPRGLFHEYLEMMIQFGFVTLFVAAFPLAPLFAWLNNVLEIRTDADKFITQLRRPMAASSSTIGIWYDVMFGVSRLAILTNAFLIAFTTGFIHRLVYATGYSEDGTTRGYVNYSLSYFNVSDFSSDTVYDDPDGIYDHVQLCRYMDYREPPWAPDPYEYTATYWHVLAAQFIFIVAFENLVILITNFVAYLIPDAPRKLREQIRREAYLTNEIILTTELEIARGDDGIISDSEMTGIRRRAKTGMLYVPRQNLDNGSMTNKLELDTEDETEKGRAAHRRRGTPGGTSSGGDADESNLDESAV